MWFTNYGKWHAYEKKNNVISNSKSDCCNDTFTDVQFASLLAKNV